MESPVMHAYLDDLRRSFADGSTFEESTDLVRQCVRAGANFVQILGAIEAGVSLSEKKPRVSRIRQDLTRIGV